MAQRLSAGLATKRRPTAAPTVFELVVRGDAGEEQVLLVDEKRGVSVADSPGHDDGSARHPRVLCYGDALLRVASGERNLAQVLHDGVVRIDWDGAPRGPLRANRDPAHLAGLAAASWPR